MKTKDSKYADILVYREYVKEKISKNDPFSFTSKELNQLQTSFTHIDSSVYSWAKKGRSEFIHHYFYVSEELNYARLNHDVSPKSFTSIIKILFEWNYLMSTVEGGLSIEELDFCGKI